LERAGDQEKERGPNSEVLGGRNSGLVIDADPALSQLVLLASRPRVPQ
jgi:hypothetical protein